jgi:DNA replication protein DnaC
LQAVKITGMAAGLPEVRAKSEKRSSGFMEFFLELLWHEVVQRSKNEVIRRRKAANLSLKDDFGTYDSGAENGLNMARINQLRELNWLALGFSLMLMGLSGTSKTFLAAGLGADAVEKGYKTYFKSVEDLTNILKLKDMTRRAKIFDDEVLATALLDRLLYHCNYKSFRNKL